MPLNRGSYRNVNKPLLNALKFFVALFVFVFYLIAFSGCSKHPYYDDELDLDKFRSSCRRALGGRDGAIVAITGQIYAVVNPETAIGQAFPVGSAFKPLTVIAAIEEKVADKYLPGRCAGSTILNGREYHCWVRAGHGVIDDMPDALAQSCNLYFYRLGTRFKGQELLKWARRFGFGKSTGIKFKGYEGSEAEGSLPETLSTDSAIRFAAGDTPELQATPLQMAVFAAAIANQDRIVYPWDKLNNKIIKKLDDTNFNTIAAKSGLLTAWWGMYYCVTSPKGTCHSLNNTGYDVAGKTGTARKINDNGTHAWFIGFSPAQEDTHIAIAVFIKNGRGARDAIPVAREVFQAYYRAQKY